MNPVSAIPHDHTLLDNLPGIYSQATVLIPTLNESQTIGKLVKRLLDLYPGIHLMVVDDNSRDGTVTQVRNLQVKEADQIEILERSHAPVRGITASIMEGILACRTTYFIVMDADFQHPPEVIGEFCRAFEVGIPWAIGTRKPYHDRMPFYRYMISRMITFLARSTVKRNRVEVADPLSGLFGGETKLAQDLIRKKGHQFEAKGYKILFDMLCAFDPPPAIQEITYAFAARAGGTSKCGLRHGLYFLGSLIRR